MRAFGYRFPGFVVEHGPVEARSLAEARTRIRQRLGLSRLPWGFQVWDLSQRPLKAWSMRPSA
ncbi:MAG TPA: hypothetical protein VFT46_11095 [Holophagaceae bacterium]|nr:hypothetical protein [Holophagaceae bacterium]